MKRSADPEHHAAMVEAGLLESEDRAGRAAGITNLKRAT
jgi:hypothetical protein